MQVADYEQKLNMIGFITEAHEMTMNERFNMIGLILVA